MVGPGHGLDADVTGVAVCGPARGMRTGDHGQPLPPGRRGDRKSAAWAMMATGSGLWALPAAGGLRGRSRRHPDGIPLSPVLLAVQATRRQGPEFDWLAEVWPMQWRLGLQGVSLYGSTLLFNPFLLYYHSAAEAGRFGMTWAAVVGLQTIALAWIQTRVPMLGYLAARRDVEAFERCGGMPPSARYGAGSRRCGIVRRNRAARRRGQPLRPAGALALAHGAIGPRRLRCTSRAVSCRLSAGHKARVAPGGRRLVEPGGRHPRVGSRTDGRTRGLVAAYGLAMVVLGLPLAAAIWSRHRLDRPAQGAG